jgi:hypothetical protein
VAAYQVDLQLGEPLGRDGDLGEFAEPCGYAVHNLAIMYDALDVIVRASHPLPCVARQ